MNSSEIVTTARLRRILSPFSFLLIAAFFVRGGALFVSLDSFNDDPDAYSQLADNWAIYGVFGSQSQCTAFRPPLYPWTLKTLKLLQKTEQTTQNTKTISHWLLDNLTLSRNASIALWHWILGMATVVIVYHLALCVNVSRQYAALAAFLTAIDPILLQQSRLVMTETLAAFFSASMMLGVVICVRARNKKFSSLCYLALGLLFGMSTLCRPAFFTFLSLTFLGLVTIEIRQLFQTHKIHFVSFNNQVVYSILRLLFFLIGVCCVTTPWLLRNIREFNKPILTTTHGGYTLYLANNPDLYKHYQSSPAWTFWNPENFHETRSIEYQNAINQKSIVRNTKEEELFQDEWTKAKAKQTITENPQTFLYASFIRFGELWRVIPYNLNTETNDQNHNAPRQKNSLRSIARIGIGCFYSLEFLFAILGVIGLVYNSRTTRNTSISFDIIPIVWGGLLILSVQLPHLIYWTNMRMRAPLETFLPILTIIGILFLKKYTLPTSSQLNDSNQYSPPQNL